MNVVIKSIDKRLVQNAVKALVSQWRVKYNNIVKIIWFGSYVNGIPTPGSDVDICIIFEDSDKPFRERIPELLPFDFPVGLDLFPYTKEEFESLKKNHEAMYIEILSGKEI